MAKKYEEMLNIPSHKENTNQNHSKIPLYSYYNNYHQEHKQQILVRMWKKKEPSYIAGRNVN
jgi:hypothetical protein